MHIAIIASGSRGDVQPYIALGKGLHAAGHGVRLVTHKNYENLVKPHGVDFWPVEGDVQQVAQSQQMRERLATGSMIAVMSQMAKEAKLGAVAFAEGALDACRDVDLVLAGFGGVFVGIAIAEKLELPLMQAYYIPFTPTKAYPSFLFPQLRSWLGTRLNRLSYSVAQQMIWQGFRSADKVARREVLGLPAASFWGPFKSDCLRNMPIIYGYSPLVIPKPVDWGEDIHVTGYWFLDSADDWSPPEALVEFIQSGTPPVFVGFGSMSSRDPAATAELVVRALAQAGQRAVMLSGWGGLRMADLPDTVFMVDSVPFTWLFPRMAAVVHHGGAGTTSAGLRAGVPSVVVPFFADQPFWGWRVAELGVGLNPFPRKKLTVEQLAHAIERAVSDQTMRQRAADLGAKIQAEDGVGSAVDVIDQLEQKWND